MKIACSIMLAGGLSTRMVSNRTNKVCLELLGKPVICRALEAVQSAQINQHWVVLGACARQVMECVSSQFSNVSYAFQIHQHGTADAVLSALRALPAELLDSEDLLLIVPGHRIVAPQVIEDLLKLYEEKQAAVAEVVLQTTERRKALSIYLGQGRRMLNALLQLESQVDSPEDLSLSAMTELLSAEAPAAVLEVNDFAQVLGFANPEEFLDVTEVLRKQQHLAEKTLDREEYHPVQDWLRALNAVIDGKNSEDGFKQSFFKLYENDPELAMREARALVQMMEQAERSWGAEAPVAAIRSPGRVNVMGRHVDHQGGNCNLMTIGYETLMVTHLRNDDKVVLQNINPDFPAAEFAIGELVRDLPWDDWQTLVASRKLAKFLKQYGVGWSDYIKAVFLRFQKHFYNHRLRGMDIIVAGNVPMAAGLSSSSTLVVGAAEAVVGANRLDLEADKLITLCGEGEWFVGTRGGAADHAAVKLGECNKVVKVGFFDFKVERLVAFPSEYSLIVSDSGIKARKSSNAKDQFNHRVSCYRIGLELLRKLYPQYATRLQHLRDFNPDNLGVPLDWFYKLLKALPENVTRRELEAMLPEVDLSIYWDNHAEPEDGLYPVRGVVMYGLSECARSARYVDYLEKADMKAVGNMMNISHDGDRVMKFDGDGNAVGEYKFDTSDEELDKLISAVRSDDPAVRESAELWRQPGSYRCSLPEIDRMVDLACGVPGVVGAQLAGAGLGGCMMVMVHNSAIDALRQRLVENYYKVAGIEPRLLLCRPIAGAGAIRWQDNK